MVLLAGVAAWGQEQVVPLGKMGQVWTRDKGAGSSAVDEKVQRDGKPSVRVEHKGEHDWSLASGDRVKVAAGDVLELCAWIRKSGEGDASLCAIASDDKGKAINYALGRRARGARSLCWSKRAWSSGRRCGRSSRA
ncbi:MAG: hypothetical protein QM813_06030 [Verrucomicrobiota bacterium]